MAYRTFIGRNGSYWQVWDVRPERIERRSTDRRRADAKPYSGPERRKGERRTQSQKRILLTDGLGKGWLVFECQIEKRRLNPIPPEWEFFTEDRLRELCQQAVRVDIPNAGTSAA